MKSAYRPQPSRTGAVQHHDQCPECFGGEENMTISIKTRTFDVIPSTSSSMAA